MMASNSKSSECKQSIEKEHCIYKNNPLEQKELISNVVKVTRVDGHQIIGTVFTIDPVSESIVLVSSKDGQMSMDIVMGHAVCSVEPMPDELPTPIDSVFPSNNSVAKLTSKDEVARIAHVKAWLLKNRLPIVQDGEILKLDNALHIYPPYGFHQCISDNEIILGKVQELIMRMPDEFEIN